MPTRHLAAAAAALLVAVAAAAPAAAHGDDAHAPKHGGKVVELEKRDVEIVVRDGALEVHVEDETGKPADVSAAKASATVLSGGRKIDVVLAPGAGGNVLEGAGAFQAKSATVVVTLTMPGAKPEQARVKFD